MGPRLTTWPSRAGLALACVVAAAAVAQPALPPGVEEPVLALLRPGDGPAELAPGVTLGDVRIERRHIDVTLVRGDAHARVRLQHPDVPGEGDALGRTKSFALALLDAPDDAAFRAAAEALLRRVDARDAGGFFERHGVVEGPARPRERDGGEVASTLSSEARLASGLRGLAWLLVLLVSALLGGAALRRAERQDIALAAGLALGALALRLVVPPWAPLHANGHGVAELRGLLGATLGSEAALYGPGYLQLVRVVLAPLGGWAQGPLAFAACAGALSAPLGFLLARQLAPERRAGAALAGLALAIHPAHVRLSLSESPHALAGTLLLGGVVLAVAAFQAPQAHQRALACLGAAAAWALAGDLSVTTLALPLAGAAFVLVAAARPSPRPPALAALAGVALVGLLSALHLRELEGAFQSAAERSFTAGAVLSAAIRPDAVLWDPRLTPVLLWPLALAGAVGLWRGGQRRLVLGAGLAFLVLLPPSLLVFACRTDAVRYQGLLVFFPALLLSGLSTVRPWPALAAGALLASAVPGWLDVARPDVHAQAFALARHAPPPPTPILVAPREMAGERRVLTEFPEFLVEMPERVSTSPRPGCVLWVDVSCWSFSPQELARGPAGTDGLRAECIELLGGLESARHAVAGLTPLEVPHREQEFHRVPAPQPRVGFVPCPTAR